MWECGLKQFAGGEADHPVGVTPYVGVWIETIDVSGNDILTKSLLMWECGLKLKRNAISPHTCKSLLMWECGLKPVQSCRYSAVVRSLLMWECGLKLDLIVLFGNRQYVTPYVGVWIETLQIWIIFS